jgi:hypothetical protein
MASFTNPVSCCNTCPPAHGNIAVIFYYGRVKSVAPQRLVPGTKVEHLRLETHDMQQLFPLNFFIFRQITEFSYAPGIMGHLYNSAIKSCTKTFLSLLLPLVRKRG